MEPTKEELRSVKGHTAEELSLDRAETVCKFCGVSYLIFSEVKALEKKLKQSEASAARLQKQLDKAKAQVVDTLAKTKVRSL